MERRLAPRQEPGTKTGAWHQAIGTTLLSAQDERMVGDLRSSTARVWFGLRREVSEPVGVVRLFDPDDQVRQCPNRVF